MTFNTVALSALLAATPVMAHDDAEISQVQRYFGSNTILIDLPENSNWSHCAFIDQGFNMFQYKAVTKMDDGAPIVGVFKRGDLYNSAALQSRACRNVLETYNEGRQ